MTVAMSAMTAGARAAAAAAAVTLVAVSTRKKISATI